MNASLSRQKGTQLPARKQILTTHCHVKGVIPSYAGQHCCLHPYMSTLTLLKDRGVNS